MTAQISDNKQGVLIHILGTSHIAHQAKKAVEQYIRKEKYTAVAVELDSGRLSALLANKKPSYNPKLLFHIGLGGYLFAIIGGLVQNYLAKKIGAKPGQEMLAAAICAKQQNAHVFLVDQPIEKTLRRISSALSFFTMTKILSDTVAGLLFPQKTMKNIGIQRFDLEKVPSKKVVGALVNYLQKRYPALSQALLIERNEYMSKRVSLMSSHILAQQSQTVPVKILVVVGAAHVAGMVELLQNHYKLTVEELNA
jgi:pheromone shutdown protein TraB